MAPPVSNPGALQYSSGVSDKYFCPYFLPKLEKMKTKAVDVSQPANPETLNYGLITVALLESLTKIVYYVP